MQNYHTHTSHSNFFTSFKDSHMQYLDYVRRAKEVGCQILSSVEHGWQGNHPRCWQIAQDNGLKFVFGTEAYWVRDRHEQDRSNAHIILLARNQQGFYAINSILSQANEDGFYYVPRVDLELLLQLDPKDVMVTTACVSFWGKVPKDRSLQDLERHEGNQEAFVQLAKHFGSSLFLEVQAHDTEWQRVVNRHCVSMRARYGLKLIAGCDSHYAYPEQIGERDVLREESRVHIDSDHERDANVYEDYPDEETLRRRFRKQGVLTPDQIDEAIASTDLILDFEDIVYDKSRKLPTIYPDLTQEQRNQLYLDRVWDAWHTRKDQILSDAQKIYDLCINVWKMSPHDVEYPSEQRYIDAINYETDIVVSTGTADYFLIDSELVKRGQEKGGYLTPTGRGSAGGFFTNNLLGLTTIDRISFPVKLYPERFVTAERLMTSLPDIDLNLDTQEPFAEAQEELLGHGHAYPMVAYGTLKTKSAFKMYARAAGLDPQLANTITTQIDRYEKAVQYAEEDDKELIVLEDYVETQYIPYLEASETYRGIIVSKSQAPCGFLIYNGDIRSEIGLIRIKNQAQNKDVLCTVIDGATADEFGYVKNDLLVVSVIKVNSRAMQRANLPLYSSQEMILMTAKDQATWDIFAKGYTQGINQCQSVATTSKLMRYKPRELRDLCAFVAAIRPGFKSQLNHFLARQHFTYDVPPFDTILRNDSSRSAWMLYQENTMSALNLAGFEMERTYPIIKAISKKKTKVIAAAKDEFMTGFQSYLTLTQGVSGNRAEEQSELVWKVIEDSASYSFNACVSGSTKLMTADGSESKMNVAAMYWAWKSFPAYTLSPTYSMFDDNVMRPNYIVDIRKAGVRQTFRITTEYGATIDCTDNHKFPTPSGEKRCDELKVGDTLYVYDAEKFEMNFPMHSTIVSIEPLGEEMTYDIEMADPAHNFVTESGLVTCNSHAGCVSLDAIYGAYLKAHHPHDYYYVLLEDYLRKGNKDKVSIIKQEMQAAFDMKVLPCQFGQDNRHFTIDAATNTVTDSLASLKGVSARASAKLYTWRDRVYDSFVHLLVDMTDDAAFNKTVIDTLVDVDYFAEFGTPGKLQKVYAEFRDGKNRYQKSHTDATKAKRIPLLVAFERAQPEEPRTVAQRVASEIAYYGYPMSRDPLAHNDYAVVEVDAGKRIRVKLYNLRTGRFGEVFVPKSAFELVQFDVGAILHVDSWHPKPAYGYANGQRIKLSTKENWLEQYSLKIP